MSWLEHLYEAQINLPNDQHILWRELIGNLFGFASAIGGLRRRVWAWPIGIIGNVMLFTVFFGVAFNSTDGQPLFGQAARQVFFIITSIYGWYRWKQVRDSNRGRQVADQQVAVRPRWATGKERAGYLLVWAGGVLLAQWVLSEVGATWPAPRWYYWADAWIFVGSLVATYAMARGWTDFWLAWIAVDLVGVPLLLHSHYYPTAALFTVYAFLVIYGFVVWLRASREEQQPPDAPNIDSPEVETVR